MTPGQEAAFIGAIVFVVAALAVLALAAIFRPRDTVEVKPYREDDTLPYLRGEHPDAGQHRERVR